MSTEDKQRQTGRTTNAIISLYLEAQGTRKTAFYACLNAQMAQMHYEWLVNFIAPHTYKTRDLGMKRIYFLNGGSITFIGPSSFEGIDQTHSIIRYDHTVPIEMRIKQPKTKQSIKSRLELIEE